MNNTKKSINKFYVIIGIIILFVIVGAFSSDTQQNINDSLNNNINQEVAVVQEEKAVTQEEKVVVLEEIQKPSISKNINVKVYFLDVGQADSILIQSNNSNMLIDAGNNADGDKLVNYFKRLGIKKFDILVGTHPHEDHIGGMDNIINSFDIGKIYMPKVSTTTATFEDVLDAISNKDLMVEAPSVKDKFSLGDCNFTVLSVGTDANDLNSCSIVLKMVLGNNSFLFMGDATDSNENNMLNMDLESDVIKVGHHGSKTSTSQTFLDEVNPNYAVISVGKGNMYNHPEDVVINKLNQKGVTIYRTDMDGTLVFESDGSNIKVNKIVTDTNGNNDTEKNDENKVIEKEIINQQDNSNLDSIIVYVTKSGKKYHTATCRYVLESKIKKNLSEVNGIYEPCKVCNPVTK